jgi:hypothetical protein
VAPRPAPPQALYLADCNQITCVFTWVINPYLMPCLTHMNYRGSHVCPDQPSAEQLCISIPIKSLSVCGLNFSSMRASTLWLIGDCLVLWTSHVAPHPVPPQAFYLADCNQITCVFTWVIDPYLMLCLTHVNHCGSPDLDSPIITRVFTWAINPYLMPCPDQLSAEQLCIWFPMKSLSICGLNFMFNARSNASLSIAV